MRVLSLYSGGGGIDQGLKQAGIITTVSIDYDIDSCNTMKLNHPCEVICGKVSDYKESFSNFDIIVGGPPCPNFSIAKVDRSYDSTEVNLFWEIVDRIKPKYHLMENVPGVISVCKRRNFLLNAKDYGTPQNRIRRFYTNLPAPVKTHSEFPSKTLFGSDLKKWISVRDALGINGILEDRKTSFGEGVRTYDVNNPSFTLLADCRIWIIMEGNSRKLTNEELMILQGFPKDYKFTGIKASITKQIGNAVPSQIIEAFFRVLLNK